MSCRIFLDQHLPLSIAEALRNSGHDALATQEADMLGADDDVLLAFATEQGRVFLSADYSDFPRISIQWNQEGRAFPGIVLVKPAGARYSPGDVVARIEQHITPDPSRLQNSLTWLPLLEEGE